MISPERQETARLEPGATAVPADSVRKWATSLALALVTFGVFWPVVNCEFLNYDDQEYVTQNRHVQAGLTGGSLVWAFRTNYAANWHPLSWLSHMLDVELFRQGASGPHLVNLLFHVANTVLLFLVLQRMTAASWRSAFVAALFGLHPLHVESVAWISERKDVLSTFFFMLTLWAYGRYAETRCGVAKGPTADKSRGTSHEPRTTDDGRRTTNHELRTPHAVLPLAPSSVLHSPSSAFYALALLSYALGLMSKPMLVTLPFVLLLLDFWPLRRISDLPIPGGALISPGTLGAPLRLRLAQLAWEKAPFFLLSALSCVVTFWVQNTIGAVQSGLLYPFLERFGNSLVAYALYLSKAFWPVNLAIYYPYPEHRSWGQVCGALALLAGVSMLALRLGRQRPYLIMGWLWFLGMLVPVIGWVQVGGQSMADRYSYVPLIGLFVALAWGSGELLAHWQSFRLGRITAFGVAAFVLAACGARTRDQLRHWQNSGDLFRHALAVTQNNEVAHNSLGSYLANHGRADEAMKHFSEALRISPYYADARKNLGIALASKDCPKEAVEHLSLAVQIQPGEADAFNRLGAALAALGRTEAAIENFRRAIQLDPELTDARRNLGASLASLGRLGEAVECYHQALQIAPADKETLNHLGIALTRLKRLDEAMDRFGQALKLDPNYGDALNNLGIVLVGKGRLDEAVGSFRQALRVNTNDLGAQKNLDLALRRLGHTNESNQASPPNAPP
jgi:protein O-mannosyl-transferase